MPSFISDKNTHNLISNDIIQIEEIFNNKNIKFESHFSATMFMISMSPKDEKKLKYDYEKLKALTSKKIST